ncbi:hypothetical protein [Bradyrhizobium japonicum]|uniref:hypothetical protein n=1 Tax=Bradyrhizobium japonicum TaxID=375 RepID=UPI00117BED96|nr:hypothetical protein [Bradyrhizobium japonicum]
MAKSDPAQFWLAKTWINVVAVRVARRRRSAVLHLIAFSFTGFGVAYVSLEQRFNQHELSQIYRNRLAGNRPPENRSERHSDR